ncbi:hypothetical protein OG978_47360 (plasmid) [Streptomyces sp. NBC_01591]|uniref:hypothetical protein n=1 Tax=Streptomyces sp. NBC_01591 TaxID=2975888 RepID=UPI002DD908B8|nr:hypothetical protein [Streptomyces sp. NBC_01591]WSD66012.1 hypothetical protein OG978_00060 [Streptomyces sp. NBC_01591]WSD73107.1 hypothetical protein OG978_40765 [Streptomyces sp. NBC_01591]WSD73620.1 hypothetical protein OG978_40880 [Streptomyces sp. NBC_01591]WSD74593.1 hypothetical protein OG978_47360 [Streptomyces sp. NBC_01591]
MATGGTLLVDEASGVIFVGEATSPPPDSPLTEAYFQHGVSVHLAAGRKTPAASATSWACGTRTRTPRHSPAPPAAPVLRCHADEPRHAC